MRHLPTTLLVSLLLLFNLLILPGLRAPLPAVKVSADSKEAAFQILKNKCNVCHRRQNPFKIFTLRNMDKNAVKINEQVFVKRRMPKGDKIRLTEAEYRTLKTWLSTQKIN